jgi:hypothetical protein
MNYDKISKILSRSSCYQKHLFSHNNDDNIQRNQDLESRINELFPTRQPQPSAKGFVDCKPHAVDSLYHMPIITDSEDHKPNVADVMDQKENISPFYHMPIITDSEDYKPNVADVMDRKENISPFYHMPIIADSEDYKPNVANVMDQKENISPFYHMPIIADSEDYKPNVADVMDQKENISPFYHMPIIADSEDYKPNVADVMDRKENISELHYFFGKNMHESSKRWPMFSDAKYQPVHPCQSIKLEAPSKITIPNNKFIWRSALSANGLKMKIWKEKTPTPREAFHKQPQAKRKKSTTKKRNLRAWFQAQLPCLAVYSSRRWH